MPIGILQINGLETRTQDVPSLVHSQWNLLQPVNRLPPEVLSQIAQCFLCDDATVDTRSIVPLTHVCKYWRDSITSDPANWTLISNYRKGLMELTIERAKAIPLQVTLAAREDPALHPVPAPYIQKIGTLRFTEVTTLEELEQAVPGFPQSTPNLRSLKLRSVRGAVWDRSVDPFELLIPTLGRLEFFGIPLYPSILRLKSLTVFVYVNVELDLHMDTLLDFLEENHSLKRVDLGIIFREDSLRRSQRRTPTKSQLQYLSIHCLGTIMDGQALISSMALQRGARLDITSYMGVKLKAILPGVSPTHLFNMHSPTLMEYRSYSRNIRLTGPNGEFSLQNTRILSGDRPFVEFPLLSLHLIQELYFVHRTSKNLRHTINPVVFDQSFFPALKNLAIDCGTSVSHLLSALFLNPSSPLSLETLAFLDCDLDEDFMEKLTRYASDRKGTTSSQLHQVVIIDSSGAFPSVASICKLKKHVPIVDVKVGTELPRDLLQYPQ